ncbi:hypothetical protein ACLX1H_011091 [Fusarium chlamydosporum]
MIFPVNHESAQTITGHPEPIISACSSNSSRYQVFHIQHTPNVHKIFIPTNLPRPAGHLYYVTDTSPQDRPQTALPLVADIINSPDHMGNIHESRFVGFIASEDLHHVEKMIKDHSEVLVLEDADPLRNDPARCEVWRLLRNPRLHVNIGFPGITTQPIVFTSGFTPIIPTDVGTVRLWIGDIERT